MRRPATGNKNNNHGYRQRVAVTASSAVKKNALVNPEPSPANAAIPKPASRRLGDRSCGEDEAGVMTTIGNGPRPYNHDQRN